MLICLRRVLVSTLIFIISFSVWISVCIFSSGKLTESDSGDIDTSQLHREIRNLVDQLFVLKLLAFDPLLRNEMDWWLIHHVTNLIMMTNNDVSASANQRTTTTSPGFPVCWEWSGIAGFLDEILRIEQRLSKLFFGQQSRCNLTNCCEPFILFVSFYYFTVTSLTCAELQTSNVKVFWQTSFLITTRAHCAQTPNARLISNHPRNDIQCIVARESRRHQNWHSGQKKHIVPSTYKHRGRNSNKIPNSRRRRKTRRQAVT